MLESLLLTILVGIFFLIGMFIPKLFHNQNKLITLATGITFIIMLFLILFDLSPEIIEILDPIHEPKYIILIIIFVAFGFMALKLLDFFVPEHSHNHQENEKNIEEHNNHFFHIGIITAISLIIHNILEGISIYITGINDFKAGILMAITVGIHNLPLGIEVSANMNANAKKKTAKWLICLLLILSSSFGASILYLFKVNFNVLLEGILLSITLGMILYIALFELWHEVKENKKKREMQIGIVLGFILSVLIVLL